MKRLLLMTIAAMLTIMASAQKETKITLTDGNTVSYDSSTYDSIRILRNLTLDDPSWIGVKVYLKGQHSKDYVALKVETAGEDPASPTDGNANRNRWRARRLEYPHLSQDSLMNLLVIHSTSRGINYSLEWDCTKKANRWTCYELYASNLQKNVSRKDDFREDDMIPSKYRTTLADYSGSGYSRGHLCPSSDRLASREENSQTFFLSNMQPQIQGHNGGVWAQLEDAVRSWAKDCDTLYVVKAATIDKKEDIKTYTSSGLIVPAYFYMALLAYDKAKDNYHALGIWSPHATGSTTEYITIDELEKRTGIDFFCNLPDEVEDKVEATVDESYWNVESK